MIFTDKEWNKIEEICEDRISHYKKFFIKKKVRYALVSNDKKTTDECSKCGKTLPQRNLFLIKNEHYCYDCGDKSVKDFHKTRMILAPDDELKDLQTKLMNQFLYQRYIPSVYATGFIIDRSIVHNAMAHVGSKILVNVDLKDFFPTINDKMLEVEVFLKKMVRISESKKRKKLAAKEKTHEYTIEEKKWKLTKEENKQLAKEAALITKLVTYPYKLKGGKIKNALPQGAPTSPALSNIVCFEMDNILSGVAKRNDAVFTRYADDITMSSASNTQLNKLIPIIKKTVEKYGFKANEDKIHVNRRSGRMSVTGLVVNDKVSYGQGRLRIMRAQLHNYKMQVKDGFIPPFDELHYRGFAAYFKSFDPSKADWVNGEVDEILAGIKQLKKQRKKVSNNG